MSTNTNVSNSYRLSAVHNDVYSSHESSDVIPLQNIMSKSIKSTAAPAPAPALTETGGKAEPSNEFTDQVKKLLDLALGGTIKSKDDLRSALDHMTGSDGTPTFKTLNDKKEALAYVLTSIQKGAKKPNAPPGTPSSPIEDIVRKVFVDVLLMIDIVNTELVPNMINPSEESGLKIDDFEES